MKIIFAQGNPGREFAKTRHNTGFFAVDHYADVHSVDFQPKSKFHADIAELDTEGEKTLLVKPTTFYNDTGKTALALANFYKVQPSEILVIHDELMLPFGTLRTREKGSDAGNKGIRSLNAALGENYPRIRVGIGNELSEKMDAYDFVLSKFSAEESEKMREKILPKINELIDEFIAGNHSSGSHKV